MLRDRAAPRVLALSFPDLPLQRAARGVERGGAAAPPLAIVAEGRVLCCDPAALRAGVRPAGTVPEALAACGSLRLLAADPAADRAALRAVADALLGLSPAVELAPPDALLLDASSAPLLGGEEALAQRALSTIAELGYRARGAVASGRGPAGALARHGPAERLVVPPGDTARALAALPPAALGLAPAVAARLARLGIGCAGALAALPEGTLAHRFGPEGVLAARLARGEDDSPLVPYVPETLPEEALELEAPADRADPLLFALKRLADRVAARLEGRGLGATRLKITLSLDPRGEERIAVPLASPTAAAARWLLPIKEHLFSLRLPAGVTALRLAAVEVAPVAVEQLALGDRPDAVDALDRVLARLAVRLGDGASFAAEPVDRYRPEAAYRAVRFRPPQQPGIGGGRRGAGAEGGAAPCAAVASPPRPTRLLPAPEPIVAEGEGGRLTALRVEGRARAVLAFEGPERLRGEWWASPFDRDYYRVRLEGVGDCWVYRDCGDGRLWLHGFFD